MVKKMVGRKTKSKKNLNPNLNLNLAIWRVREV
jgi:hypothetical protein